MSRSLSFNSIDLSIYGLSVLSSGHSHSLRYFADLIQLPDLSLAPQSAKLPRLITLEIIIEATTNALLLGYLDSIKSIVGERLEKALALDTQTDRYWLARFLEMSGNLINAATYKGVLIFSADDPMAYDNTETTRGPVDIDADPKTITEPASGVLEGTGYALPVYTLITGAPGLTDVTIKVENVTLAEELQWTGSLTTGQSLEIDVPGWVVNKEGVANMATVTGLFPRLKPGESNSIKVTGFGTTGTLTIVYSKRYL